MTPAEALMAAIKAAGSQTALARACGCTQSAISLMLRAKCPRLSHPFVLPVEAAYGIPRHVLRPDIYPQPTADRSHRKTGAQMNEHLIRMKEVLARVPIGRSTIYTRVAKGTFPRALNLGGGVVAWRESDIDAWIESLPERIL